jgi:hypothetical protein
LQEIAEIERKFRQSDAELLQKYAVSGCYGPTSSISELSLQAAYALLCKHLGRKPILEPSQAIESSAWWFIPDQSIGTLGFIVEKESGLIFPLGSGLASRSSENFIYAHWLAIEAYLAGHAQPIPRVAL